MLNGLTLPRRRPAGIADTSALDRTAPIRHRLGESLFPFSREKFHRTTAQSLDLWRSQLRRTGLDQQLRAQSPQYVGRLSADVCGGLCVDPVVGPKDRRLMDPSPLRCLC